MATARFSCGTRTGRGSLALLSRARLNASTMGGKSVPGLAKKKSTPCSASERRKTSPAIGARVADWAGGRTTSLGRMPPVVLDGTDAYNCARRLCGIFTSPRRGEIDNRELARDCRVRRFLFYR
jgi:hypothetical protein